ncbi:MAG: hypothetical protein AB1424_15775 [Thermodesulfobacteriota bacterium]
MRWLLTFENLKGIALYTQVLWNISLNDKREGEHELEIQIYDYNPTATPFAQIIALPQELNISKFQSEANNTKIYWSDDKTIEISSIVKAYPNPLPNPLIVHCKFYTEKFVSVYDDFTVLTLYYIVKDMKASSINILITLPKVWIVRYYIDKCLLKIISFLDLTKLFGKKGLENVIGAYRVTEASGAQVQRWEVLNSGPSPSLRFIIPEGAFKTNIDFSYVRALSPFWYLISLYVSYKILHWLASIIW